MDPGLWEALRATDQRQPLEVVMQLYPDAEPPPALQVVARFGEIVTGRVLIERVLETRAHPSVRTMKAKRRIGRDARMSTSGMHDPFTSALRARRSLTGRRVLVGSVDFGLDFRHPHFRNPDGTTRLLAIWDQGGRGSPPAHGYGALHTRSEINRALATPDPYATLGYWPFLSDQGQGAHGTHVLDIAAGNGALPGSCSGVAPEAELIFVHLAGGERGVGDLGDSVRLLEALDFIFKTAADTPCVVNASIGAMGGPHDGSSCVELAMDFLLQERPGRCICQSTGNYFSSQTHAMGTIASGASRVLHWRIHPTDTTRNELEIWYPNSDELLVELWSPDGALAARAGLGETTPVHLVGREVGRLYHRANDPANAKHHVDLFLDAQGCDGEWSVGLTGIVIHAGTFHAWIERDAGGADQSVFAPEDCSRQYTTGTVCNGRYPIVVGAYDGFEASRAVASFSSSGPTADGRSKPDLLAPGVSILAARSAPRLWQSSGAGLTSQSGASMAAPHVTGAVALLFEALGRPLAIDETRQLLRSTADAGLLDERLRTGAGYLNLDALLHAATTTERNTSMSLQIASHPETLPFPATSSFAETLSEDVAAGLLKGGGVLEAYLPEAASGMDAERFACKLFDELAWGRSCPELGGVRQRLQVVGYPGRRLSAPLQAGDILIRRGEDDRAHTALLVSADGAHVSRLGERGLLAESTRLGIYHQVVEGGAQPHTLGSGFARRTVDALQRVPSRQMIVRLHGEIDPVIGAALITAGGTVAGAALSSIANPVFQRIVDTAMNYVSGGYEITSVRAINAWEPTPPGLCTRVVEKRLRMKAMVPAGSMFLIRDVISTDVYFNIKVTYDQYSIRDARIEFDRSRSGQLHASTLRLNFDPIQIGGSNDPLRMVSFNVSGSWNPIGPGDCNVSGSIEVSGTGEIRNNVRADQPSMLEVFRTLTPVSQRMLSGQNCGSPQDRPTDPQPVPQLPPQPRTPQGRVPPPRRTTDGLEVFFATGRASLTDEAQRYLAQWFTALPEANQLQLREGRWPIQLQGYASPDGDAQRNLRLSRQRCDAVARALRTVIGPGANVQISSRGEFSAREGDPALARKVAILVPSTPRLAADPH